jgi:hypothetical protein
MFGVSGEEEVKDFKPTGNKTSAEGTLLLHEAVIAVSRSGPVGRMTP